MTINEIMQELRLLYGDNYDVRLVPSVIVGGGRHLCRATISACGLQRSATHRSSYRIALHSAYEQIMAASEE